MATTNQDLLKLELKTSTSSSFESTLLVCPTKGTLSPSSICGEKLVTSSVPRSQVLGKVRDFLGVMAEANEKLQNDVKENSGKDYNIEELTGNENEFIEMDLVLGVADLHTPEAVAAAESAMAGSQRVINLADNDSDSDAESSDDENEDDNDEGTTGNGTEKVKSRKDDSSGDRQPKKRPKIIELL
ncbi:uncharacterized protein C12orf45 homolog [Papaver somniferum]|uniref:uncharacterized protein C12orf45 homolog n=1 Tax=Papaver somniferum TaxID=3469 RepID=UPI000E6FE0C1|nr:uncharacterized protein C12orf45 homolog [Papaver somniferum]